MSQTTVPMQVSEPQVSREREPSTDVKMAEKTTSSNINASTTSSLTQASVSTASTSSITACACTTIPISTIVATSAAMNTNVFMCSQPVPVPRTPSTTRLPSTNRLISLSMGEMYTATRDEAPMNWNAVVNQSAVPVDPMMEITAWLRELDLPEYAPVFQKAGYDRMASIRKVSGDDLAAIGVKRGHAKVILDSLEQLRAAEAKLENTEFTSSKNPFPVDVASYVAKVVGTNAYNGDDKFLQPATERTKALWNKCLALLKEEQDKKGVLDVDPVTPSAINAFKPGYIDQKLELIVGVQTDAPLKRAIKPQGGVRVVKDACEAFGYKMDAKTEEIFTKYRKTHNQGVFDVYTPDMRKARTAGILTGLPDAYGRGRIIGDYRRVPLYGVDYLINSKRWEREGVPRAMTEDVIRQYEEIKEQMNALTELKDMARSYGVDVSKPATTAREAIQSLYLAYLSAVKEQDGAAMSLGRVDVFLDSYIERDIEQKRLTESEAQELIDQFVMKLRLVRHLRPPAYNALFAGDPTWVTCVLGGIDVSGRHMVTKTAYRLLHTLVNLGPAPEPNLTVLYDPSLPTAFKQFCASISLATSSIQYESDSLMRPRFGSDYGIACCVSAMTIGKEMQFFGARCNMPKLLLYTLNEGIDELNGEQVVPKGLFTRLSSTTATTGGQDTKPLDFKEVKTRFEKAMDWMTTLYVNTMNTIHYMHDKYNYERLQMALHDTNVKRYLAFGVAGLSVVADSLSAIKHAQVYCVRNAKGVATDFKVVGDFPKYGNDDDHVDSEAKWAVEQFSKKLGMHPTYRNSIPTLSILTITSNVVYGQHTGNTPDGRKRGEPFAPGANPMHGRDKCGCLASLNSVAKLPYELCLDGISNTFCVVPSALGKQEPDKLNNLVQIVEGYFVKHGHHLNVNVMNRDTLLDAMAHPDKYPQLTIRVSGYAVNFNKLTPEQQREVLQRTFHEDIH